MTIWNLRVQKNLNIEKIAFKVVQIKFLAMHVTKQKSNFNIFTVGSLLISSWNMIFTEYPNDFWQEILIILTHTMYFLAIADIYKHREFVENNYMYIKKVWLTEQFLIRISLSVELSFMLIVKSLASQDQNKEPTRLEWADRSSEMETGC